MRPVEGKLSRFINCGHWHLRLSYIQFALLVLLAVGITGVIERTWNTCEALLLQQQHA